VKKDGRRSRVQNKNLHADTDGKIQEATADMPGLVDAIRETAGKPRRGPRPKYDPAEDARIVAAFRRANAATGVKMKTYPDTIGMDSATFNNAYARHAKREQKQRKTV
jgi:hypothetical protein